MTADTRCLVITGASSGLGLALARRLARDPRNRLILPARNDERAAALRAALGATAARIETPLADLASQAEVLRLADRLAREPIAGLAHVAGLQFQHGDSRTIDGIETTFAVNHLAAFALSVKLLPALVPGAPVLFVGSGTHDRRDLWARAFGFRGGRYTSVARLARGDGGPVGSRLQHGRDLYATSKLCNVATALALAARIAPNRARFYAIDPGLMPGTGLARAAPAPVRFVWTRLMRPLLPGLPGVSTAERSAAALDWLLTAPELQGRSGLHVDYRQRETPVAAACHDPALIDDLVGGSLALCGLALP